MLLLGFTETEHKLHNSILHIINPSHYIHTTSNIYTVCVGNVPHNIKILIPPLKCSNRKGGKGPQPCVVLQFCIMPPRCKQKGFDGSDNILCLHFPFRKGWLCATANGYLIHTRLPLRASVTNWSLNVSQCGKSEKWALVRIRLSARQRAASWGKQQSSTAKTNNEEGGTDTDLYVLAHLLRPQCFHFYA